MKKNLISVGILALLIVNLVLTGILMFSVISTNKKTAALVGDIAKAINLELTEPGALAGEEGPKQLSIADIDPQTIADLTIPLKPGADGKSHYALVSVTFSLDRTHEDYGTYGGENFLANQELIKGKINDVISSYTMEEAQNNPAAMKEQILTQVQQLFNSDFIVGVDVVGMYQ